MKYNLIFILLLSACTTSTKQSQSKDFNYQSVSRLVPGQSTEKDVLNILGPPTNRVEEADGITLNYDDPKTNYQRVSANFNKNKLVGLLWIPRENEKENILEEAKKSFQDANFKKIVESNQNPHYISHSTSFRDDKIGVTILYDEDSDSVEAIARFDVNTRVPAGNSRPPLVPYTIGE